VTIIVLLYGIGWIFRNLGMEATAHEFGSMGTVVLAVLGTGLIVRLIWQNHAGRPRR
jgi:hypothetical protein